MICMYNIAVMGDYDSIFGFAALGADIYPVNEEEDAVKTINRLKNGSCAVIFITEKLAALIPEEIEELREAMLPAVILIPGVSGNTGEGMRNVKKSVEQAVGSDIIFNS